MNASQFTPTQFSTAEDKARFANHLIKFIKSGYRPSLFPKWFYTRLSMCFGHIAHYNLHGFYEEWFITLEDQQQFLNNIRRWPCHGHAEFTFCDVEKAIQKELSA